MWCKFGKNWGHILKKSFQVTSKGQKEEEIMEKEKSYILFAMLFSVLMLAFVSPTLGQTNTGTLTATATDEPSVITVSGTGFNASETVQLQLLDTYDNSVVYTFPQSFTTESDGTFEDNVTLPDDMYGTYYLMAVSQTSYAYIEYTIEESTLTTTYEQGSLTVTPDDSNIIEVSGSGFNASETVTFELQEDDAVVYTFTKQITTDSQGSFSAVMIIPTSMSGEYSLVASTSGVTANVTITVPDLTGETGATGETGETGATGEAGATGTTDPILGYVGVALSVTAICVSIYCLTRKQRIIIKKR
jgi:hypothetical protein